MKIISLTFLILCINPGSGYAEQPEKTQPQREESPANSSEKDPQPHSSSSKKEKESSKQSRAGSRTEVTDKILPGQAVDFPWDM